MQLINNQKNCLEFEITLYKKKIDIYTTICNIDVYPLFISKIYSGKSNSTVFPLDKSIVSSPFNGPYSNSKGLSFLILSFCSFSHTHTTYDYSYSLFSFIYTFLYTTK